MRPLLFLSRIAMYVTRFDMVRNRACEGTIGSKTELHIPVHSEANKLDRFTSHSITFVSGGGSCQLAHLTTFVFQPDTHTLAFPFGFGGDIGV